MKRTVWLLVVVLAVPLTGCKKPNDSAGTIFDGLKKPNQQNAQDDASQAPDAAAAEPLPPLKDATPTETVTEFLGALRAGNEDLTEYSEFNPASTQDGGGSGVYETEQTIHDDDQMDWFTQEVYFWAIDDDVYQ